MQDDTGTKRILTFPFVYSAFQTLVGASYGRRWILSEVWRVKPGMHIVDIGCGPGDILDSLPEVEYIGLDVSEDYIRDAKQRFGHRGTFVAGTAPALLDEPRAHGADLVTCTGVLHHLDDANSLEILNVAHTLLKPGGRFIAVEPTYLRHQGSIARWLMSKDRGMAIREERAWRGLAAQSRFGGAETSICTGVLRIPYTHIVIECTKAATPLA